VKRVLVRNKTVKSTDESMRLWANLLIDRLLEDNKNGTLNSKELPKNENGRRN
jgi:hypothetical protein